MSSIVSYIWGAAIALFGTVGAVYWLVGLWRSDKHRYTKAEETLRTVAVLLFCWGAGGFGAYMGWESSYAPGAAPQARSLHYLELVYIPIVLGGMALVAAWFMKKRRAGLAKNDDDLVWSALYAEYGWKEARRLYENYRLRQDPRSL